MSVRSELEKIDLVRDSFIGEFSRLGKKKGGDTVLLINVFRAKRIDDTHFSVIRDGMVTDHLWFNLTKGFEESGLEQGDRVLFDARVKRYRKGSVKRGIPLSYDYKLSHPSKVQKVSS